MSGRKVGKRKRRGLEAASGRWSPPTLSRKDFGCQVNFFGEELCLKNTSTVATQTEKRTVEVEMVPPRSSVKTVVSEVEECADICDEMVSVARLQDFLRNSKLPCAKAPSKSCEESNETNENEEIIRKVDRFFHDKGHDPKQLTKEHLSIKQSPLVISTSEKLQKSVSESKCNKCNNPGTLKFAKVSEPKTGIFKLDFVCSECKSEFYHFHQRRNYSDSNKTKNLPYELHHSCIHCLWPVLQGLRSCHGHSRNKPLQRKAVDSNN